MIDWHESKIKQVRALMLTGLSARDCAARFHVSRGALIGLAHREFGGWGPQYTQRLVRKRQAVSPGFVRRIGSRVALTSRGKKYLRAAWSNGGINLTRIQSVLGITAKPVRRFAQELDLGEKAQKSSEPKEPKPRQMLWPDGILFEDHPKATAEPFSVAKALRHGSAVYGIMQRDMYRRGNSTLFSSPYSAVGE